MASSWDQHTGSSSQRPCNPPPVVGANQPYENLLLTTQPAKRPRGRPLGSKNPIAQPVEPSVKVVIINVNSGNDVMESIFDVARRCHVSLSVLGASGTIKEVTLSYSPNDATTFTLHGPFTLLSLTGSYLYNNHYTLYRGATHPSPLSFGIHLITSEGDIIGGTIGGKVLAGDDVSIKLSVFKNPVICKYVPEGDDNDNNNYNN